MIGGGLRKDTAAGLVDASEGPKPARGGFSQRR